MSGIGAEDAPQWFLRRGMPTAVPWRLRWHHLLARSAPALVGWAVLMCLSLLVVVASGDQDIDLAADATPLQWITLAIFFLIPPAMLLSGWAITRVRTKRVRTGVAIAAIAVGVVSDWYGDETSDAVRDTTIDLVVVAVILIGTGLGVGAVLGWALRTSSTHLRAAGRLFARALPVVLLTVLVFFNASVWSIATNLDSGRVWLLLGFMASIAVAFLIAGLLDVLDFQTLVIDPERLADTPFGGIPDPVDPAPLRLSERLNLVVIAVTTQTVQIAIIATTAGVLFFVLGMIVLTPTNLGKLTGGATPQSVWFDVVLPVSTAQVHMTAVLTGLTFMYLSARAFADDGHRRDYIDPLLADLGTTITARNRYRG
ncbi:hypothetical protein [Mycolicibacterium sediminis]|uniref:Integral membrane protein n=1 Tax=Mycolicibacterium sediminis TaxID=1286180 RepID=A0A7I7QLM8_9MYCO|nr:hypothetical protein [Mycolicibacterium sediminis]BBY27243.1 integral membrane protein [Mycolicibacterium sediminis]